MKRFLTSLIILLLAGLANAVDLSNAKWYTIKVGNGGYLSTKSTYTSGIYLLLNNTSEDLSDNGLWTFIGNETDGYSFYNRKTQPRTILIWLTMTTKASFTDFISSI